MLRSGWPYGWPLEVVVGTSFLWLEITGRCQLQCVHCYAESGPDGTHGTMTRRDWVRVLDKATGLDVEMVQFIGGEPTMYPGLAGLVEHALGCGLQVEVFSNLVHVSAELWAVFSCPGVSLATSYYSDNPDQHAAVTLRPSYRHTRANIAEAVRRGIPLRAGVIDLGNGQRAEAAQAELFDLGVRSVGYDRLRQVGRGVRDREVSVEQLCGHCGDGAAAVSSDGVVWPCVFARWLPVGNVLEQNLAEILDSREAHRVRAELARAFVARVAVQEGPHRACQPNCNPGDHECNPDCQPNCSPCNPRCNPGCQPFCNPSPCQPQCSPRCSPTCDPMQCAPRTCWPPFR
ncbi:MAG: radical SAM protein [Pseudonocardiaceae bacterium]